MEARKVYLDNSATTSVAEEVLNAMLPYFRGSMGNPNSLHEWGRDSRRAVDEARNNVAALVGASPSEIIFTGSGSVSDNLAIKGSVWSAPETKKHIITSAVEHHAVLDTFKWLGKKGWDVTFLPVDEYGMVNPDSLADAIRSDTILASVMYANNEVGTINPIAKLGEICRERGVLFYTDAVQATGPRISKGIKSKAPLAC